MPFGERLDDDGEDDGDPEAARGDLEVADVDRADKDDARADARADDDDDVRDDGDVMLAGKRLMLPRPCCPLALSDCPRWLSPPCAVRLLRAQWFGGACPPARGSARRGSRTMRSTAPSLRSTRRTSSRLYRRSTSLSSASS
jgi:hypothetical protein